MISLHLARGVFSQIGSRIGALGLILVAGMGTFQNLAGIRPPGGVYIADATSLTEARFEVLRKTALAYLREPSGKIGYVSDRDANIANDAYLFAVQYSLAPMLCVPGRPFPVYLLDPALKESWRVPVTPVESAEWLIGDFGDAAKAPAILRRDRLAVVRDFGSGVMLLRRIL